MYITLTQNIRKLQKNLIPKDLKKIKYMKKK